MASKEADVYSYGIVLLEMMVAKSPTDVMFAEDLNLNNYARSALLHDELINIIDPVLVDDNSAPKNGSPNNILVEHNTKLKCISSLTEVGLRCSSYSPQDRMRIDDAIGKLQFTKDILLKEMKKTAGVIYA